MEDESKLWTFILPDSIMSSGVSANSPELEMAHLDSEKTVYNTI